MQGLAKNLIAGAVFASLVTTGAVIANDDIQRKVIEIRAMKDQDITVMLEEDGIEETIILSHQEVSDPDLLEARLSGLSDEVRETLMQALDGTKHVLQGDMQVLGHNAKKVFVINKGQGESISTMVHGDLDFDFQVIDGEKHVTRHIIMGDEQKVLKGHTDAIVRLIERGEFSQEELDKIQSAVDAKR